MRPSYDILKTLWLYSYARASLLEAEQWLDAMPTTEPKLPQSRALVCAAVVAYARPFTPSQVTKSERPVPLKGVAAPMRLANTHEMILKLRDKVMGHKDATPAKGDSTTPNIILIRRDTSGFDLHTIMIESMTDRVQTEMKELCAHFVAHCESVVRPIIDQWGPEIMKHPIGEYELVVCDSPEEWIRRRERA